MILPTGHLLIRGIWYKMIKMMITALTTVYDSMTSEVLNFVSSVHDSTLGFKPPFLIFTEYWTNCIAELEWLSNTFWF
jgi:hypothetical protein